MKIGTGNTGTGNTGTGNVRTVGRVVGLGVLPTILGLFVAATSFGGSVVPWRSNMVDFEVYRYAGRVLLEGGDFYHLPDSLPFLYPPFAALVAVPLALVPSTPGQIAWTIANVIALMAVLHRFGLKGWPMSLVATACMYFVEPVRGTLTFGQLGIFLMALVVLDLVPGPRLLSRKGADSGSTAPGSTGGKRRIPEGVWSGVATALKLTPGIFLIYLIACRSKKAVIAMLAAMAGTTLITAAILPARSLDFWGRLAHGDTGLGGSIIYYTNQSVMADVMRILKLGPGSTLLGLALAAAIAVVGVWAGSLWHRAGNIALGVSLCGLAGLLASPVSWSHHFVWVVPLALCLLDRTLPGWFRYLGWVFVGWIAAAPFKSLPNGGDKELAWSVADNLLASTTALLGIAVLVSAIVVARRARSSGAAVTTSPGPLAATD